MSNTPHPSSQRDKHLDRACTDVHWAFFPEGFFFFGVVFFFFIYTLRIVRLEEVKRGCLSPCVICVGLQGAQGVRSSLPLPAPGFVHRGLGGTGEGADRAVLGTTESLLQRKSGRQIQANLRLCQLLAMKMLLIGGYRPILPQTASHRSESSFLLLAPSTLCSQESWLWSLEELQQRLQS